MIHVINFKTSPKTSSQTGNSKFPSVWEISECYKLDEWKRQSGKFVPISNLKLKIQLLLTQSPLNMYTENLRGKQIQSQRKEFRWLKVQGHGSKLRMVILFRSISTASSNSSPSSCSPDEEQLYPLKKLYDHPSGLFFPLLFFSYSKVEGMLSVDRNLHLSFSSHDGYWIFFHMYIFFEHLEVYRQPAGQFNSICVLFAAISVPRSYLVV